MPDTALLIALMCLLGGLCLITLLNVLDISKLIKKIDRMSIVLDDIKTYESIVNTTVIAAKEELEKFDADTTKTLEDLMDAYSKLSSAEFVAEHNGTIELEIPNFPKLTTEIKSLTNSMNKLAKAVDK